MQRLIAFPAGRRSKWVVLLLWLVAAAGFGVIAGRLHDATTNNAQAFLPHKSASTEVAALLEQTFPDQASSSPALVVYQRAAGLDQADRARIEQDVAALERPGALEHVDSVTSPFAKGGIVSQDGTTAVAVVNIDTDDLTVLEHDVTKIRDVVGSSPLSGLDVYVTGTAGLAVDSADILGNLDQTLLLATVILIVALLLAIYRAPFITIVPLVAVGLAYAVAAGIVYLVIEALDLTVASTATSLLIILMFGAGTDYCIYLIARYKEELRRHEDKHDAMQAALARTTPAIVSCGLTVAGAMLVLLVADLESTRNTGPVLAIGIAVMMVAGLTLLPALMTVLGRLAFWPRPPKPGSEARTGSGLYRRVGAAVVRRPVAVTVVCVAVLGLMVGGMTINLGSISVFEGFRGEVEAIEGQQALARALPPGETAPTTVLVESQRGKAEEASTSVASAIARLPHVSAVRPGSVSASGDIAELSVVLDTDPYSDAAADLVPGLRTAAEQAAHGAGATALVGGPTAAEYDTTITLRRDFQLIFPITLVLIFCILVALLRALVAPIYLIATVVLSFFATLGLSYFCFDKVFESGGSTAGFSTFLFIFLVALGVDYNIFLMSRIREEAERRPVREAVLHGLESTGGVITSAGIILAGTFACLMIVPIEQLFQLGFGIAVGVFLDTFVVRTLIVPAVTDLLGERAFWPGRLARRAALAPAEAPGPTT